MEEFFDPIYFACDTMYNTCICILLLYYERIVHSLYIVRNVYCCCSFDVRKGQARIGARKITPVLGKNIALQRNIWNVTSTFKCSQIPISNANTKHCIAKKNIGGVISKCSHYKSKLGHVWIFMKLCVLFKIVTTTTVAKGDNGWWFFSRSDPKAEVGKGRLGGGEWGKKPCLSGNVGQVGNPP